MATTATPVMTWEAFEQLPDSDGFHRELLQGHLQILPWPPLKHSQLSSNILGLLLELTHQGLGEAYAEAGYKLSDDPPTWIQPDVSFLTSDRHITNSDDYFCTAPDLAVEIISPSESAADIQQKIILLLAAGCQTIWVIYPKTQTVHVFQPGGHATICNLNDTLPALSFAPEFRVAVSQLFGE